MASPFQPLKAQATTGRPVKGLTTMPSLGAVEPLPSMPKASTARPAGSNPQKSFTQPTPNKSGGAYTHETRGGTGAGGVSQGIQSHNTIPHLSMHPGKM